MPVVLILAFIVVPILELAVIDQVADAIGLGWTLVLLLVDSVAGGLLVRHEGRRAWRAFRDALGDLRWPGDEVAQGALVLVGGALLLTPGFVTDAVGLALVVPLTRALASRSLRARFGAGQGWPGTATRGGGRGPRRPGDAPLDVEVVSIERDDPSGEGPRAPTSYGDHR